MKRLLALVLALTLLLCGCGGKGQSGQNGGQSGQGEKTLTGTLEEIKDFMFIVEDESGNSYVFDLENGTLEGLQECGVGDKVTVTYTGELSVVDSFTGKVISVRPAEEG